MKKLIVLLCVLIGSVSTQSVFGMFRALLSQGPRTNVPRGVPHARTYATKRPKKSPNDDSVGFVGDKVGGIKTDGDIAGGKICKDTGNPGGHTIYAGPFSSVNTGIQIGGGLFTPFKWLWQGACFTGRKTKELLFPNTIKDKEKLVIATAILKNNVPGSSVRVTKELFFVEQVNEIGISGVGNATVIPCTENCSNKKKCTLCEECLIVTASEKIMPYLAQSLNNGILTLGFKNNTNVSVSDPITYHVKLKEMPVKVDVAGSVLVNVGPVKNVPSLEFRLAGSSGVVVNGNIEKLLVTTQGSSTLYGQDLTSNRCTVGASGSSVVNLGPVLDKIEVDAAGSSKVSFKGNPGEMHKETSGSAKIRKS